MLKTFAGSVLCLGFLLLSRFRMTLATEGQPGEAMGLSVCPTTQVFYCVTVSNICVLNIHQNTLTKKKSLCVCSAPPDTVNFSLKSLSLDTPLHYFYPSLLWPSYPSRNPLCLLPKFSLKDSFNPWPLTLSCIHPYLVRMNLQKLWFVLESLLI